MPTSVFSSMASGASWCCCSFHPFLSLLLWAPMAQWEMFFFLGMDCTSRTAGEGMRE